MRLLPHVRIFLLGVTSAQVGCHRIASPQEDDLSRLCGATVALMSECEVVSPDEEAALTESCLHDGHEIEDGSTAECLSLYNDFLECLVGLDCEEFVIAIGPEPDSDDILRCGSEREACPACYE